MKLSEVVGQSQVTEPLESALKAGKVSHAFLFIGPRGCGKTSVARILAHEVNGFKYEIEDDYIDIIEIDGASNRGIDDIRELREKVTIAPTSGKYKVYIIDEVHMLTTPAFNALLKTLEEPPEHVIFIMATTDAYKVPVTITSRAQTYTFQLASTQVMLEFLKSVAKKEKIKIDDGALELIARRGGGSFRDSLSLLDQISTLSEKEITKDLVVKAMGLPEDEKIDELLREYTNGDIAKVAEVLKGLLGSGVKSETVAEEMMGRIIEKPQAELMPLLAKLPEVKEPFAEARLLVALASGCSFPGPAIRSSTSYAGTPAEPSLRDEPVGSGRNIRLGASNREMSLEKNIQTSQRKQVPDVVAQPVVAFDWNGFLGKVQNLSEVVYKQLQKCEHEVRGGYLHLYPRTKIIKNILESKNNKNILLGAVDLPVEVHEAGEHPESAPKDETLDKISAIMGGEVFNDGGNDPF